MNPIERTPDDGERRDPGIRSFTQRRASGWPTTMHVLSLGDGDLLIHSPTWIDDATLDEIENMGTTRILFAPNHHHHKGLERYRHRFPRAMAVASKIALRRLGSLGHEGLVSTEDVDLPGGMRWLVPDGTKSGEAWIAVDGELSTWVVCDAFFNEPAHLRGFEGMVLRALNVAPGLSIGITFEMLGIREPTRYAAWVAAAIARERPARILFSHGDPIEADGGAHLLTLLRSRHAGV